MNNPNLKPCPACGHAVAKTARTCPQCGKTMTTGSGLVIALIVGLVIAYFVVSSIARGEVPSAADYQAQAVAKYPALKDEHSEFHYRFIAMYQDLKKGDSFLLKSPDWPLWIADRIAAGLGNTAPASPPISTPSSEAASGTLAIEIENVSASSKQSSSYSDGYGGYDTATSRERKVRVKYNLLGSGTMKVHFAVYWVGKKTGTNSRILLSKGESDHDVSATKPADFIASSGKIEGRDLNLPLIGYRDTSGYRIDGWVVHTTSSNSEDWKASDSFLINFAKDQIAAKP